ncbi:MAG: class I SAM-dependent methyltransferase [Gammaproteobacteria bacterium]
MNRSLAAPTVSELVSMARDLYPRGPLLLRWKQWYRPRICPFHRLLPHAPVGSSVLDIGCGGGLWLGLLAVTGGIRLGLGMDASAEAISLAQTMTAWKGQQPGAIEYRRLDVTAPWPEGTFDVVSLIDVLHHVPPRHQEAVVRKACARVAPEGALIYKDMTRRPLWRALAARIHDAVLAREWIWLIPIEDVEEWAAACGLTTIHSEVVNQLWYGHVIRVFARSGRPALGHTARDQGPEVANHAGPL